MSSDLTVDRDPLASAKRHYINLSTALELTLTTELKALDRQRWLLENHLGFESYNTWVNNNGVFGDAVRTFQ